VSLDLFIVLACCILGILAHVAVRHGWLAWLLRVIIGITFLGELVTTLAWMGTGRTAELGFVAMAGMCLGTGLLLFMPVRGGLSRVLTWINQLVSGQVIKAAIKHENVLQVLSADSIFAPSSVPHMVALWIYVSSAGFLLGSVDPSGMKLPTLPIPMPVPIDQLFSYNGLGLVLLALCGVGVFVARKPLEAALRLGWQKPTWTQVGIGVLLIFMTFAYDYLWSLFTHQSPGDMASKLSNYNSGTFTAGGGAGSSLILALATGLCAGIGEETLMRGALQPVFGILPAAILHGLLHGQFSHAPILIVQVAGWSTLMGIARRYTNTTTTIIGHAGFNFLTTFLFAFNP